MTFVKSELYTSDILTTTAPGMFSAACWELEPKLPGNTSEWKNLEKLSSI